MTVKPAQIVFSAVNFLFGHMLCTAANHMYVLLHHILVQLRACMYVACNTHGVMRYGQQNMCRLSQHSWPL